MKTHQYESIIILIIVFITIISNFSAFLYRNSVTPPGRVFAGTQFYSDDYAVYLSYIKQGQQGRWTVVRKYTSEPHQPSFIHEEYLLLGKLKLSPVLSYHLSRLFLCMLFLLSIYCLILRVFPKENESTLRIATFMLATLGNGFLTRTKDGWTLFLSWLTELDPTQRFGAVPHYQLGFITLLGIFICFYSILTQTEKKANLKNFIPLIALGLIGGFVLPASLIIALSTLAVFAFLTLVRFGLNKDKNLLGEFKFSLLTISFLLLSNLPALFYHQGILKTPSWGHILAWEAANRAPFTLKEYLLALGPVSLFTPLSLLAFKERKRLIAFLFSWLMAVFLWSFVIADLAGFNPTRFLQNPVYIPMAILTALGIKKTATVFVRKLSGKPHQHSLALIASLIILVGLPANIISLRNQFRMYNDFSSLIYPEDYFIEAFKFLEKNTAPDEAVLTFYQAGNQIPFLAGNTVYLGHLEETFNYPSKVGQAEAFYSGRLTDSQAENFLKNNRVKLVFYGPQEKSAGGTIEKYSFLEPVFDNQQLTIFRLKNG